MSADSSSIPPAAAPIVEFCITGDEVLRGVIADTNSAITAARLYPMGFALRRTTVVGDRGEDIRRALLEIASRAEFCIVSGGLGPTTDDLTAACAAQAAGVELVRDDEWLNRMRERWARRRTEPMPVNNERQAWLPAGCERLGNPDGSAPAFALRIDRCQFFFLPGVPREYHRIIDELVLPSLARALPEQVIRARTLQCVGITESALDQAVLTIQRAHPLVRFGFRTKFPENHLSLVARAATGDEAARLLAAAEQDCRGKLGSHIYGEDGVTFAQSIGNLLVARQETLCCAESCTGGLLSQLCTEFAGSSRFFAGGFITYSNELKQRLLAVPPPVIAEHGAVSVAVAGLMAQGARAASGATWALSITGIAGPDGGSEAKPVGTVCVGLDGPGGPRVHLHQFRGDRGQIRTQSAFAALQLLRESLGVPPFPRLVFERTVAPPLAP